MMKTIYIIGLVAIAAGCAAQASVLPGIEQMEAYLPLLEGKRVAAFVNHTSTFRDKTHLVDKLLGLNVEVKKVFTPEHGLLGTADAGEHINDERKASQGYQVISLYGAKQEPSREDLQDIDVLVVDVQDVGVRFYTYISSLDYILQSCMKYGKRLVVLDRPNPNGHFVDGGVLEREFASFVGMRAVPVVYGMTIGEYAKMLVGEEWLMPKSRVASGFELLVVPCVNYTHRQRYVLPIPPSPNLRTDAAVMLYPSLCYFEGTVMSVGRGTDTPFEMYGHPSLDKEKFAHSFTPQPNVGSKHPPLRGQLCYGRKITVRQPLRAIDLTWLVEAYKYYPDKANFFVKDTKTGTYFFDKLAGSDALRKHIVAGTPIAEIKRSWQKDIEVFLRVRKKYLLYSDF